jgi:hypothetical protein
LKEGLIKRFPVHRWDHSFWPVWSCNKLRIRLLPIWISDQLMRDKYVDDIFAIIRADRVSYFFDEFNAFHVNFEFTMEIEQELYCCFFWNLR